MQVVSTDNHTTPREALLFGHYHEQKGWRWTASSERICRLLWEDDPVLPIRVWEDPEGKYWAWWNNEHQTFDYVNSNIHMVRICFANGPEAEEARGRGKLLRVSVEQRAL